MKPFPLLLLATGVCLFGQQAPPKEGVTMPFPVIPVMPASSVVDPDKVVLEVGGIKITAKQLDALIDVYPENQQMMARGPGKEQFADTLVRMLVMAEEARKRKLDQTEKFKEQMRFSEANLLAATLTEQLRNEVDTSEPVLRKYYEQHRCEYQTWKPRHILVRTKGSPVPLKPGTTEPTDEEALARAEAIRKKIKDGADFAEVAKNESDDINSANQGGGLGEIHHGQVVPTLEDALCSMNAGELSLPVKTQFGYHIIRMDSKDAPAFEAVKAQLEQKYRPEATRKLIDDMIAQRKVVKDPVYYAPMETNDIGAKK